MKTIKFSAIAALVSIMGVFGALSTHAQTAGNWLVRGGLTNITPVVTSGDLSAPSLAGTKSSADSSNSLSGGVTYMVTNNLALDIPLALPFTSGLNGEGALAGVGKIGSVDFLPATLFAQYRFGSPNEALRPYIGAGPTYAYFFNGTGTTKLTALTGGSSTNPTTLKVDSKFAPTVQVGFSMLVNKKWFIDGMVAKTFLKTTTTLSTGQTQDITLDPVVVSFGIGYRFK